MGLGPHGFEVIGTWFWGHAGQGFADVELRGFLVVWCKGFGTQMVGSRGFKVLWFGDLGVWSFGVRGLPTWGFVDFV